ncbi:MAG TPA: N-acetylmuramoyl-L-alanine amidase, partial [Chitinophagaceae bacterium]|nr:N-acetylmuramoyl-L-alanine amidase [Chitinophagaceae bacterium]
MKPAVLFFMILASMNANGQHLLVGRTTGQLPFLKYGLGEDRLGGAKMTFLDSNILMKVVDSVKDDYKVQLSAYHFGWLGKTSFKKDSAVSLQPYYLTGSWKVYGDNKYDYVTISMDERLPYRSAQEINPSKIVVDIFGVTSNTNWITQLSTIKEIRNVYYVQAEDDVFRVIIELKHQQHWGYFIHYDSNKLVIRIKRQPQKLTPQNLLVAIDAGHGGSNTGATGVSSGIIEKEYTLKIAKQFEKYLNAQKVKTFMTRTKDTDLAMIDRTMMLREEDPDILISLHLNSAESDTVKGVSTYYRYIGFRPLSQAILKRMQELKLKEWANVGAFNFSLSGPT